MVSLSFAKISLKISFWEPLPYTDERPLLLSPANVTKPLTRTYLGCLKGPQSGPFVPWPWSGCPDSVLFQVPRAARAFLPRAALPATPARQPPAAVKRCAPSRQSPGWRPTTGTAAPFPRYSPGWEGRDRPWGSRFQGFRATGGQASTGAWSVVEGAAHCPQALPRPQTRGCGHKDLCQHI